MFSSLGMLCQEKSGNPGQDHSVPSYANAAFDIGISQLVVNEMSDETGPKKGFRHTDRRFLF
jgi:hypothetical protein